MTTNFEKIKAMSIEEMAEVITVLLVAVLAKILEPLYEALNIKMQNIESIHKEIYPYIKQWLESESEDAE